MRYVPTLPRAHQWEPGYSSQRLRMQNTRVKTSVKPAVDMENKRLRESLSLKITYLDFPS